MMASNRNLQRGMTLIELMIAMTLSLLVAAAMIALFANSKETYVMNENLARLQENGRFAMNLMARDLRWADYRACITRDLLPNAITGDNDSGFNASDTVTIIYQTNDCAGVDTTFTTAYTLAEGAQGRSSLFRSVNGAAAEELVEDIADVQLLYGEDTDDDDIPNYYVDIGSVTDLERIVSVRLTITAQTPAPLRAAGGEVLTRDFASTIVLRNRIP